MGNYSTYTVVSGSISGSAVCPISLTEAKGWLKVDVNTDDSFINMLITASLNDIEAGYGFPIQKKILEKKYPTNWTIEVAPFTVDSILSVKSGSNDYTNDVQLVDNNITFGVLPDATEVVVRFVAGESEMPMDTKFTMLKYITDNYEVRTSEVPYQINKSMHSYDNMVGKRKFFYF